VLPLQPTEMVGVSLDRRNPCDDSNLMLDGLACYKSDREYDFC